MWINLSSVSRRCCFKFGCLTYDVFLSIVQSYMRKILLKNIVWKEGRKFVSWNLNTGVSSFGTTKKAALTALSEALELYFEDVSPAKAAKVGQIAVVPGTFEYA